MAAELPGVAFLSPSQRVGREVSVCGRLLAVDAPVVLWSDPGGYNAYLVEARNQVAAVAGASTAPAAPETPAPRYGIRNPVGQTADLASGTGQTRRPDELEGDSARAWPLAALRDQIDLVVVHYDACGVSRECFRVLHYVRGLSTHFMIDLDGTIYQTLDVRERAWHATIANDRSIGIEIASPGAVPIGSEIGLPATLAEWYARDAAGDWRITIPAHLGDGGLRTPGFIARPALPGAVAGVINGQALVQFDFTPQQYESLARLVAALATVFPRVELECPRAEDGQPLQRALTPSEFAAFRGVLGHWHVQNNKTDPGPAFCWDEFLERTRMLRKPAM